MVKNNGFGTSGANPDRFSTEALPSKTNAEVMEIMEEMLSLPAEDVDIDFVNACLDLLDERDPIEAPLDPAVSLAHFQAKYPELFAPDEDPAPAEHGRQKRARSVFRYAGVLAASLLCVVLTANAFGFNPVQAFLKWVDDTIQVYSNPSGLMVLPPEDPSEYHSLDEALDANGAEDADRISWVPEDYELISVTVREVGNITYFSARYDGDSRELMIRTIQFENESWSGTTEREEDGETYFLNGREYYIVDNYELIKAGWGDKHFTYEISGQISEDELYKMIDSIT